MNADLFNDTKTDSGFTLRKYQTEAVHAGIDFFIEPMKKDNNGIIVLPTGSGKSLVIACIINGLAGKTIVLQPSKEILEQNHAKLKAYGYHAGIYSASMNRKQVDKITFATIGSVVNNAHLFSDFNQIIIDECFPAGTLVDDLPIESLVVGDVIRSFNHENQKVELKKVVSLFKKEVKGKMMKVTLTDGTNFICTENHPIFTKELGYVPAIFLSLCNNISFSLLKVCNESQNNSELFGLRYRMQEAWTRKNRQNILQRQVPKSIEGKFDTKTGNRMFVLSKKNNNSGSTVKEFQKNRKGLLFEGLLSESSIFSPYTRRDSISGNKRISGKILTKDDVKQSHVDDWRKRKNDQIFQRKDFFIKGRKWSTNKTANVVTYSNRASNGVSHRNKRGETFISVSSKLLQGRSCRSQKEVGNRSGRSISQTKKVEVFRSQENRNTQFVGLESVEVYESRGGFGSEQMCSDNFVYNIEVEDNHNYFVADTLVHNCHLVNPGAGMYKSFIEALDKVSVLGLTATPYRLSSSSFGSMLKFITRTRPRIFKRVLYFVQNQELFKAGYLAKLRYFDIPGFDRSKLQKNSTGADYTDSSVRKYYQLTHFDERLRNIVQRLVDSGRKNVLVFTQLVDEARVLSKLIEGAALIHGETPPGERTKLLKDFKAGKIKVMCNVGVLTTGFDYPELETVVIARPTMSLALYYQMIGRAIRIHPGKKEAYIVDLCDNIALFGAVEDIYIEKERDTGLWVVTNRGKPLTNVLFGEGKPSYLD